MENNQKKLTIIDVADALGVSKTTVSRAISGKGRIGAATRERVLNYINEHNYIPSAIAKGLAQSKTFNIGWVIPADYSIEELPFLQNCLLGISVSASEKEYDIIVSMVLEEDISQLTRAVINHKIDGAILSNSLKNEEAVLFLQETKLPFVALNTPKATMLELDAIELGMDAFNLLYEMIEDKAVNEETVLGYTITIQESTN